LIESVTSVGIRRSAIANRFQFPGGLNRCPELRFMRRQSKVVAAICVVVFLCICVDFYCSGRNLCRYKKLL